MSRRRRHFASAAATAAVGEYCPPKRGLESTAVMAVRSCRIPPRRVELQACSEGKRTGQRPDSKSGIEVWETPRKQGFSRFVAVRSPVAQDFLPTDPDLFGGRRQVGIAAAGRSCRHSCDGQRYGAGRGRRPCRSPASFRLTSPLLFRCGRLCGLLVRHHNGANAMPDDTSKPSEGTIVAVAMAESPMAGRRSQRYGV